MIGGHGAFGSGVVMVREIADLPAHAKLRIKFNFFSVASWDNESFIVEVDGVEAKRETYSHSDEGRMNVCDETDWNDGFFTWDFDTFHNGPTATIRLSSTLD